MENKFKQKDKVTQDVLIEFAKFLVSELEIKLYNNTLYFKDSVKYSSDEIKLKRLMTEYLKLSSRQDNEVISQLYKYADYLEDNTIFKVKLRNGYINGCDVINKDFGFTPFYLDVEYNPKAYNQDVDKFLNFICNNDKDMHLVIEEILGHCLLINNFPHKIFFLVGNGANGKSTFLEMINAFCGR